MNKFLKGAGFYLLLLIIIVTIVEFAGTPTETVKELNFSQVYKYLTEENISEIRFVDSTSVEGTIKDSKEKLKPAITSGTITKIYPEAKNQYLIGNGTGFVNDSCIIGIHSSKVLKVGMKAKPKKAVSYDGINLDSSVTKKSYKVIEIKGKRVVLGDGLNTAFHIDNLSY